MVRTSYPESSVKTFNEYCEVQVTKKIQALARNVAQVEIVFMYTALNLFYMLYFAVHYKKKSFINAPQTLVVVVAMY